MALLETWGQEDFGVFLIVILVIIAANFLISGLHKKGRLEKLKNLKIPLKS
jgi:hypothetical protein